MKKIFVIPLILIVLIISGGGYFIYNQYQTTKIKQAEEKRLLAETEKDRQEKEKQIKEALEKANQEIESLKQKQNEQEKEPQVIVKETIIKETTKEVSKEIPSMQLTNEEISTISNKIVYIECYFNDGAIQTGSGVLDKGLAVDGTYMIETNAHVIFNSVPDPHNPPKINCTASLPYFGLSEKVGFESVYSTKLGWFGYVLDRNIDKAWLYVDKAIKGTSDLDKRLADPFIKTCYYNKTGMDIYIFGYPAYAVSNNIARLTLTKGVISGNTGRGYDSLNREILESYFTTAQIDGGNSGGLAVTKLIEDQTNSYGTLKTGEICAVGTPTWVSIGTYANVGLIQNR
ncbi:MAG: hypothetical protein WC788_04420 [Candidatus Paceibacterota bacterium]